VEFRSSGPIVSKSDVIRVASVPARVLAIMKFDPSNLRPRRILMRLVAGLVALVVRHATAIAAVRERKKQCPQPVRPTLRSVDAAMIYRVLSNLGTPVWSEWNTPAGCAMAVRWVSG
jgi:hypothetical protein